MFASNVDATIHFKHSPEEVAALNKAIEPLLDNIRAVSTPNERGNMRRILNCNFFRRRDALAMHKMLIRACKHSRANLADYFPMMRPSVLEQAQALEDAVQSYWTQFTLDLAETEPTH